MVGEVLGESFLGYILEREYRSVGAGMLFICVCVSKKKGYGWGEGA